MLWFFLFACSDKSEVSSEEAEEVVQDIDGDGFWREIAMKPIPTIMKAQARFVMVSTIMILISTSTTGSIYRLEIILSSVWQHILLMFVFLHSVSEPRFYDILHREKNLC